MNEYELTEDDLDLDALRDGDKAAFATLVELYADRLYNLALKLTGDTFEAEDVLQEALISAYKHIGGFEGRSQVGTWLYRSAYPLHTGIAFGWPGKLLMAMGGLSLPFFYFTGLWLFFRHRAKRRQAVASPASA